MREFRVELHVVVVNRRGERMARLELAMRRIHEVPEAVMHAVAAHLHHHEKIGPLRAQQLARDGETPLGHRANVGEDARLVGAAEIGDVEDVFFAAEPAGDFRFQLRGKSPLALVRRREKAAHHLPIHRSHRKRPRHAEHRASAPRARKDVPQAIHFHPIRRGKAEAGVSVTGAVTKAVDAERAGVAAARHARPRGHGDRRHATPHATPRAEAAQPREGGQVADPAIDEGGFEAIKADDAGAHGVAKFKRDLVKLLAGDPTTTTPAIGTLKVQSMGRFGTSTQDVADVNSNIRGALGKLIVGSDVEGVWVKVSAVNELDGKIGSITIGGSLRGTAAKDTGEITATGGFGTVAIKGSIVGGDAVDSGRLAKSSSDVIGGTAVDFKSVSIGGSIVGGGGPHSGEIATTGSIFALKIVGNIEGGSTAQSGRIEVAKDLPSLTIGGSLIGKNHSSTAEIIVGGVAKKIAITGSILGGDNGTASAISETGYIQAGHLAALTVGGSVVAGKNNSTGTLDKSGSIRSANEIGTISVLGDLLGNSTVAVSITAQTALPGGKLPTIGAITVGGTVERANILAGYDTATVAADGTASIGKVSVLGDWVASNLIAGFAAGKDGKFGTSDDTRIGTPALASKIASITILGQVAGTPANTGTPTDPVNSDSFAFEASNIGLVKLGLVTLPLSAALNTDQYLLAYTTNHDVIVKETFV